VLSILNIKFVWGSGTPTNVLITKKIFLPKDGSCWYASNQNAVEVAVLAQK
jgi:hypothetical protein